MPDQSRHDRGVVIAGSTAIQGVPMNGDSWIAAQGRNDKARIIER
jgi:hypothetical protein